MERSPRFWFIIGVVTILTIQTIFIAGGMIGYGVRDSAPAREVIKYVNQTIEKPIPVEISIDTEEMDYIKINGKLIKEAT